MYAFYLYELSFSVKKNGLIMFSCVGYWNRFDSSIIRRKEIKEEVWVVRLFVQQVARSMARGHHVCMYTC